MHFSQEHLDAVNRVKNCKTLYEMLQVNRNSSGNDIKKAFKRIALILHPDKNQVSGAEEAFAAVSNAMNLLTKPVSRRIYSSFLDAVATDSFYGHDASHYPPKWWCDASYRTIEKMEFCLSSGYNCANTDCERQRKNHRQSQQRDEESRKRSDEGGRKQREETQKRKFEEESRKSSEEEARKQREENQKRKFEEESRKRSEEDASTVLETFTKTTKLIYRALRHQTVRWIVLFIVFCYYFPLLRQIVFYWPLRLILWTNVGRLGLLGGFLWLPFTDNIRNIQDAASRALEILKKTIKLVYMALGHKTVRWITLVVVSCYYFPLLRLYVIYRTLRLIFCTNRGRIGLLCGLLLLLITDDLQNAISTVLEVLADSIKLIHMSLRHEIDSWIILFGVCCYYYPLLREWALYKPFRIVFCTRLGRIGLVGGLLWLLFMSYAQDHRNIY